MNIYYDEPNSATHYLKNDNDTPMLNEETYPSSPNWAW